MYLPMLAPVHCCELVARRAGQIEVDFGLVGIGIVARLRIADIGTAPDGNLFELIPFAGAAFRRCARHALEQFGIRRHVSAERLKRGLPIAPGLIVDDLMRFEPGGGLDHVLDPAQVVDARQLNQNLIAAELVRLDDGFTDAEGVGARLDDLQSLIEGALFRFTLHGGLHRQGPGVAHTRRDVEAAAVARFEQRADIVVMSRGNPGNLDKIHAIRIGLGDGRAVNPVPLQIAL